MTTSEYLLNAAFVLLVLRQAKERELDRRSVIVPLILMFFVGAQYLHTLPTAGNDLVLIVVLALVGLTLGVLGGFATHVRAGGEGVALARVGWIAGGLLVLGIGARMAFAFAIGHGFEPAVRSLQHRAPDRRGRLAGGARADGAGRGRLADRGRPGSRPPARRRRDPHLATVRSSPARFGGPDIVLSSACGQTRERSRGGGSRARRAAASPPARNAAPARAGRDRRRRDRRDQRAPSAGRRTARGSASPSRWSCSRRRSRSP